MWMMDDEKEAISSAGRADLAIRKHELEDNMCAAPSEAIDIGDAGDSRKKVSRC